MAVESYKMFDYVLAPSDKLKIEYKGPNPFRIYGMLPKWMQIVFHGRGKNIFEKRFKWDITTDPREFFFELEFGDASLDNFSKPIVKLRVFGMQPSDPNDPNGLIYIEIKPILETEFKFKNRFEKMIGMPFVWTYHKLVYNDVRRRYIQILKEQTFKLAAAIREELGITEAGFEMPELSGAGVRTGR